MRRVRLGRLGSDDQILSAFAGRIASSCISLTVSGRPSNDPPRLVRGPNLSERGHPLGIPEREQTVDLDRSRERARTQWGIVWMIRPMCVK